MTDATRQLDLAPEDLRGWEWRHLHSRLDDSTSVIRLPTGGSGLLLPAPDRLRVGIVTGDGLRLTDLEGRELSTVPLPARGLVFGGRARRPASDFGSRRGSIAGPFTCWTRPAGASVAWTHPGAAGPGA